MLGQRLAPRGYHRMGDMMNPGQLRQALGDLKTNIASAVAQMPPHQQFLDQYCAPA
jgi:tryptophan halogenase